MRKIKFRGMGINGSWFIGYLSVLKNKINSAVDPGSYISNEFGMPFAYKIRPETVGQFTGLKDNNGKDIYEGDLVDWDGDRYEVRFLGGEWVCFNSGDPHFDRPSLYGISSPKQSRIKVVGNIFQPDLIKEGSKNSDNTLRLRP